MFKREMQTVIEISLIPAVLFIPPICPSHHVCSIFHLNEFSLFVCEITPTSSFKKERNQTGALQFHLNQSLPSLQFHIEMSKEMFSFLRLSNQPATLWLLHCDMVK